MKYLNIKKALAAWQNIQPLSEKDRERLSRRFTVDFNYNSNHIEGNTLTYGQTEILLLFGKVIGEADVRDIEEMTASNVGLRMMTYHVAPGVHGDAGGGELGGHAAGAPPGACAARHLQNLRRQCFHLMQQLRARVSLGVRVVQTIDVAEQHQQVRPAQVRHDGGQGVVVAQDLVVAGLDLGGGDGVVLVDL